MMNIIFDKMQNLVPIKNSIKEKQNEPFLIVKSEDLSIYYLNETSKEFYELCDEKNSIKDIYLKLLAMYEVSEDELQQDLIELVRDLQWKKILKLKEK